MPGDSVVYIFDSVSSWQLFSRRGFSEDKLMVQPILYFRVDTTLTGNKLCPTVARVPLFSSL